MSPEIQTGVPKGGEGQIRWDLASKIVSEVRECDRRIKEWLIRYGKLEPNDYYKIYRPNLVRVRLKILSMLGYVRIDENGVAYPTHIINSMPIDDLPVNSDTFNRLFKTPLYKLVLRVIIDYHPITFLTDIQDILREIAGLEVNLRTIHRVVKRLVEFGIVVYDEDSKSYIPRINIAIEDNYVDLAKMWVRKYARGSSRML